MTATGEVAATRIGHLRYSIVAMLFAVTIVNYADRATIAIAGPVLSKDLGLSPVQMGFVFSAFGWSYVIGQIPGGWLLDRFGSKAVYFVSIFTWSLFTLMQGAVGLMAATLAFYALFVLRFLVGFAESPSFPGQCARGRGLVSRQRAGNGVGDFQLRAVFRDRAVRADHGLDHHRARLAVRLLLHGCSSGLSSP